MKRCGGDNICETDLHLQPRVYTPSGHYHLVLGQQEPFQVTIEVLNRGEKAYLSIVEVQYPHILSFLKLRQNKNFSHVACLPVLNEREQNTTFTLLCEIGNPVAEQSTVVFTLYFVSHKVVSMLEPVNIYIATRTGSLENETLLGDNTAHVVLPLVVHAHLDLTG